jgi:uncharacterized protein (TIGR02147 family)
MLDVFSYTDYRQLLKDLYRTHKQKKPFFSYRYIGQKVGFKSAGFFTNILNGKRNISSDLIFRFAALFDFSKKQTGYFELLVLYDQAKEHAQRKYYYEKILAATHSPWRTLAKSQYEYFEHWYYVAVRELLGFYRFTGNYRELASLIRPSITPRQAKEAIDVLKRLDLIEHNGEYYVVTDKAVTTGTEIPLVAMHNFQIAMMQRAAEALDRIPRDERSLSTISFSASSGAYKKIADKLAEFRREVREIIKSDKTWDKQVYQFNFQCFPMSLPCHSKDTIQ